MLGLVIVFAGLLAAVAAHFFFNLFLLGWPLLASQGEGEEAVAA